MWNNHNILRLVVCLESGPQVGGGELAVYRYAAALAERGHDVTVFAAWPSVFMREVRPRGLKVYYRRGIAPGIKGAGLLNRCWREVYDRLVVMPRLRAGVKPDFVVGYLREPAARAARYGELFGIRVALLVFETPDWIMQELSSVLPGADKTRLLQQWSNVRPAYEKADLLIPLSRTAGSECEKWIGRSTTEPVYPGVDLEAAIRHPESEEYILYVGRLDAYKNVQDLVRAVALLEEPPPVVIAGSGYEKPDLLRLSRDLGVRCEFRGTVTEDEKWRLLRGCYFLVFPSSFEGFGIPPAEALAAEKPAVCSDIPVLREVYQDKADFFPLHDIAALADTMRRLLADREYRLRRGREGRQFIAERYTWQKAGETLERLMLEKAK